MFDRNQPFNDLPALPPAAEVETATVLKKAIAASRATPPTILIKGSRAMALDQVANALAVGEAA